MSTLRLTERRNLATDPRATAALPAGAGPLGYGTGRWHGNGGAGTYRFLAPGAETRRNLAPNPSAEADANTGVATYSVGTFTAGARTQVADTGAGSSYAYEVAANFSTTDNRYGFFFDVPFAAGEVFSAAIMARLTSTLSAQRVVLYADWLNAAGSFLAGVGGAVGTQTAWARLALENFTAPANTGFVRVYIWADSTVAGVLTARFDQILVVKSRYAGTYFDGETPDGAGFVYDWTGTRHLSAATQKVAADSGPLGIGTFLRKEWTTAPTGNGDTGLQHSDNNSQALAVTPGQAITLSSYVRITSAGVKTFAARINWFDSAGGFIRSDFAPAADYPPGTTWHRISGTFTAPDGAAWAHPITDCVGGFGTIWAAGDLLEGSALLIEATPGSAGPYFDGDTADTDSVSHTWGGTPHASQSIRTQAEPLFLLSDASSGVFTPVGNRQWSIGDPAAPDLIFGGIDGEGTEWIIADPVGWYASPPVELGLEDKAGSGAWFGRGAYKARVLEINGAFRVCRGGIDRLEEIATRLQEMFDPTQDTILSVNESVPKQITVRPASEVDVHPVPRQTRARSFRVTLTAADPWKYAAGATGLTTMEMTLLNPAAVPGMTHLLEHPLDHGGSPPGGAGGQRNADNIGQLAVYPLLRIVGPAPNPTLTNATTGEFFTLERTLPAGVEAVIDTELRTVHIGGGSNYAAKSTRSSFWHLPKGISDLRFTADAYEPAARAYVSWRPRWK